MEDEKKEWAISNFDETVQCGCSKIFRVRPHNNDAQSSKCDGCGIKYFDEQNPHWCAGKPGISISATSFHQALAGAFPKRAGYFDKEAARAQMIKQRKKEGQEKREERAEQQNQQIEGIHKRRAERNRRLQSIIDYRQRNPLKLFRPKLPQTSH